MRKETENWWKQSEDDLEKAKLLFKGKKYDGVAFYSQQACEKGMKALILFNNKDKDIIGHSLIHLAERANLPLSFKSGLRKLSPHYFLSRYPDASEDLPYELYDEKLVTEFLKITDEVLGWIKKQLKL